MKKFWFFVLLCMGQNFIKSADSSSSADDQSESSADKEFKEKQQGGQLGEQQRIIRNQNKEIRRITAENKKLIVDARLNANIIKKLLDENKRLLNSLCIRYRASRNTVSTQPSQIIPQRHFPSHNPAVRDWLYSGVSGYLPYAQSDTLPGVQSDTLPVEPDTVAQPGTLLAPSADPSKIYEKNERFRYEPYGFLVIKETQKN